MAILSPCTRACTLDQSDICIGCYRSINEICGWQNMRDIQKQATLKRCQQRRLQAKQGQKGRA